MSGDWQALADHIRAALEERKWTHADLSKATEGRVKERTIGYLLTGTPRKGIPGSVYAIEAALGWPTGTARRILKGDNETARDELWQLVRGMTDDELETFLTEYLEYVASRRRNPA